MERLEGRIVPSFLAPRASDAESDPIQVALGDVNGDGWLDLAAANSRRWRVTELGRHGMGDTLQT